jgi:hypothetical protein
MLFVAFEEQIEGSAACFVANVFGKGLGWRSIWEGDESWDA